MIHEAWAIACIVLGAPHLYFAGVQYGPPGSLTLARIEDRGPLLRPMFFGNEGGANAVLKVIIRQKPLAKLFEWRVVHLEGIEDV